METIHIFEISPEGRGIFRLTGKFPGQYVRFEQLEVMDFDLEQFDFSKSKFFYQLCCVLNISPEQLFLADGSFNRELVINGFYLLTGDSNYWDRLEEKLDYVASYNYAQNRCVWLDNRSKMMINIIKKGIDKEFPGSLERALYTSRISCDDYDYRMHKFMYGFDEDKGVYQKKLTNS